MISWLMVRVQSKYSYSLLVIMSLKPLGKQFGRICQKSLKLIVHFNLIIYFRNLSKNKRKKIKVTVIKTLFVIVKIWQLV